MYYVYLLKSLQKNECYIGSTNDLRRRLQEHNSGKSFSTKRYRPWKLIYYEAYLAQEDAEEREQQLKHYGQGLTHLKRRLRVSLR